MAPRRSQRGGREFEPPAVHHTNLAIWPEFTRSRRSVGRHASPLFSGFRHVSLRIYRQRRTRYRLYRACGRGRLGAVLCVLFTRRRRRRADVDGHTGVVKIPTAPLL